MANKETELGRLTAVHVIAPAYVQRAVFMAVLSFMFFLAMMFAFYVRQSLIFFLLSTAFLIVYLITMFAWVMQRKANVEVYENGIKYRKNIVLWNEITDVSEKGEVTFRFGKTTTVPGTINNAEKLIAEIKQRAGNAGALACKRPS